MHRHHCYVFISMFFRHCCSFDSLIQHRTRDLFVLLCVSLYFLAVDRCYRHPSVCVYACAAQMCMFAIFIWEYGNEKLLLSILTKGSIVHWIGIYARYKSFDFLDDRFQLYGISFDECICVVFLSSLSSFRVCVHLICLDTLA